MVKYRTLTFTLQQINFLSFILGEIKHQTALLSLRDVNYTIVNVLGR